MRTVICIPTYNERENLPSLAEEILATTAADIMVLDDNSPDGTGQVADLIAKRESRVRVVHRPKKEGLGRAYLDGFARALGAGYDRIFEMDADFSHQPRYLPDLFAGLEQADVVIGSRYMPGGGVENWTLPRKALSRGGNLYARAVLGFPFNDCTAGFVGFKRHVLEAIDLGSIQSEGYSFQLELKYRAYRLGFTIAEVPIIFFDRAAGSSKMSRAIVAEALWRVLELRLRNPQPKT
jgi:dolichol-phosphate mannosyltransferase